MKIVMVLGTASGGIRLHVGQLSNLLARDGHEVIVAAPKDSIPPKLETNIKTEILPISSKPSLQEKKLARQLAEIARDADIIHAHGLRAGAVGVSTTTLLSTQKPKLVVTLHNQISSSLVAGAIGKYLLKKIAHGASYILGVSGDLLRDAADLGASHYELAVIPVAPPERSGKSITQIRECLGVSPSQQLLITIARLAPQKGLPLLLNAAAKINHDILWCIAGDGPMHDELTSEILLNDLPIKLLGRREDTDDLLAAADVVVNTSYWEGQGIAVQEALHAHKAIVATEVGEVGPTVDDAAILVPPDGEKIAEAINRVLGDDELRHSLERKATVRAKSLATEVDLLVQAERIYSDLLE